MLSAQAGGVPWSVAVNTSPTTLREEMGHVDEAGPRRHRRLHLAYLILVGITAVAAIALLALLAHSR